MFFILLVIYVVFNSIMASFIADDAQKRGMNYDHWWWAIFFFGIIAIILYVIVRDPRQDPQIKQDRQDRNDVK